MREANTNRVVPEARKPQSILTSIRFPVDLIRRFKAEASRISKETGKRIGYQTLIILVLQKYIDAVAPEDER